MFSSPTRSHFVQIRRKRCISPADGKYHTQEAFGIPYRSTRRSCRDSPNTSRIASRLSRHHSVGFL